MELISLLSEDENHEHKVVLREIFLVTDFLNCLQGVFIFLFSVCNDRVRKLIIQRYSFFKLNFRNGFLLYFYFIL